MKKNCFLLKQCVLALILLITTTIIFHSCKKEASRISNEIKIEEAKQWLSLQKNAAAFSFDWGAAKQVPGRNGLIFIVPMPDLSYNNKIITYNNLILYKDDAGAIIGNVMYYMPEGEMASLEKQAGFIDNESNTAELKGNFLLYSMDGKLLKKQLNLNKAFITKPILVAGLKNFKLNDKVSLLVSELTYADYYAAPGAPHDLPQPGCADFFMCYTVNDQVTAIGFMGRRCGALAMLEMEGDVPDGALMRLVRSGGDERGSTSPPAIEIKQDSLAKYYPCMVKEVLNKLAGNHAFGKLVQPFQQIQLPNGTTLGMQGLPNLKYDFSAQDYGVGTSNYSLGTTGDYAGTSSTIRFNTAAMGNASQLLLQATAIHESGHAYANYYIKAGQYGFPVDTTRYSTWAINIVNFESVARSSAQGSGNFNDHSIFLEEYFENFWGILKAVNGNTYTDKEYQMAALYGLNNPGPPPESPVIGGINVYEIYKAILTKSFNNIKTKHGINDTDLNTFNLANLKNVPANKKLPTSCP